MQKDTGICNIHCWGCHFHQQDTKCMRLKSIFWRERHVQLMCDTYIHIYICFFSLCLSLFLSIYVCVLFVIVTGFIEFYRTIEITTDYFEFFFSSLLLLCLCLFQFSITALFHLEVATKLKATYNHLPIFTIPPP